MGPNGSGKSTLAYALDGPPEVQGHEGPRSPGRPRSAEAERRPTLARRPFSRVPVPAGGLGPLALEVPLDRVHAASYGPERRHGRIRPGPKEASRFPRDEPRAPQAIPERGVLRRREEAGRGAADGDPGADLLHPRRAGFRSRYRRRAVGRGDRGEAPPARRRHSRHHALPADPEVPQAGPRPRHGGRRDRPVGGARARGRARTNGVRAHPRGPRGDDRIGTGSSGNAARGSDGRRTDPTRLPDTVALLR